MYRRWALGLWATVLICASHSLYSQEHRERITIDKAQPTKQVGKPQIFRLEGTANIAGNSSQQESLVVVVYTLSGEGGNVQLQMLGPDDRRQPRAADLTFRDGIANWELDVWLGSEKVFDPSYAVYAVVMPSFKREDGARLIRVTHDKYSTFKDDVLRVLTEERFGPSMWTSLRVRRAE